jgi:hypothetical protein
VGDQIRDSQVFKKLVADIPNIEEDLRIFNAQYREFVTKDHAVVGSVLRSHLIVEHFLDRYLAAANPAINGWSHARLSFTQKVALANNAQSKVRMLIPGMQCLNRLRNQLVHNLNAEFDVASIGPIREFITIWYQAGGKFIPEGVHFVEEFALVAGGWLHSDTCMIERHTPAEGLPGLLGWYKENEDKGIR